MIRILFVDNDIQMLDAAGNYLSWWGFKVDKLRDSSRVVSSLAKNEYDILICGVFSEPFDGFRLCEIIRRSPEPKVNQTKIVLIAPKEPALDKYVALKRLNVFFMPRYASIGEWAQKIDSILQTKKVTQK